MKKDLFISNYIKKFCDIITLGENQKNKIILIYNLLRKLKNKNTVHVFGNGGSASVASHFSMDLTNNSNIRCLNFNDPAIITCYSNDYKFENWISRAINKYGKKDDILFLISSSGKSKNMINACKAAKKKKISKVITFTGNKKNNPLSKLGDINMWVDSNIYNHIENTHQVWLLGICDLIKLNKVK